MSDTLTGRAGTGADAPRHESSAGGQTPTRSVRTLHLVAVGLVAFVLGVVSFHPWPLDEPVLYSGDMLQHLAIVGASDGWGSATTSPELGAPGQVDWSVFPTGTERLQLAVLHQLDAVTGDVFTAANLYLLIGVTVTAVVAFAVLRWMGLRPLFAGAVAVVFAFGPAVTAATVGGHLFLFALFPVALGTYLAMWASMVEPLDLRVRPRLLVWPSIATVVVALSSAYLTTFTIVVVSAVGAAVALHARSIRRLLLPAATAFGLAVVAGVSLLPDLVRRAGDPAASALQRTAADVRRYSLRPQDLLVLDDGHPLGPVARALRSLGSDAVRPSTGAIVGLVALAGCVGVVAVAVRHGRAPRDREDRISSRLAVVVLVVLAMAVTGGIGTVLGDLGVTQIRAWSRMTVFLSFAGLAGLAFVAQRAVARVHWSHARLVAVVGIVVALTMLDQGLVVSNPAAAASARSDRELVTQMTRVLGSGADVFELPVVSFPDDPGAERLLAPAVAASNSLRFSAGFFRGGADDWQLSWCHRPAPQFVRAIVAVGFEGLLVQRTHRLVDDRTELDAQLAAAIGEPAGVSRDGTFAWYDLRPLRARLVAEHGVAAVDRAGDVVSRPIGVSYRGVTELRLVGREMASGGAVVLRRLDADRAPVQVTMQVTSDDDAKEPVVRDVGLEGTEVALAVPGAAPVTVSGVSVIDRRALGDPVLGPAQGDAIPAVCM